MIYGLVLAGGIGQRMGSDIPKQFLTVGGKAIISHTVRTFLDHPAIAHVIVLVPADWIDYTKEVFERDFGEQEKLDVTAGGALRNDTIMNGIAFIKERDPDSENAVLITHDAVRPFVTKEIIDANIEALKTHTACDTVVPSTDTIVVSEDGRIISSVPDRAKLYNGQTPQSFRLGTFEALYNSLTEEEKAILTDAAKVFVIKGEKVALVEGASSNIKITYPSDIDMAQAILGEE
ncbi:MAG: 2-C-methyl-D-erythritol 4-phosphate cytidylyltransferase [Clostridiales bacterium]|nr:2-C-methyl-D-erythritol 4-phosphate cytidylyltransferase [Clostridiales bacterium]